MGAAPLRSSVAVRVAEVLGHSLGAAAVDGADPDDAVCIVVLRLKRGSFGVARVVCLGLSCRRRPAGGGASAGARV